MTLSLHKNDKIRLIVHRFGVILQESFVVLIKCLPSHHNVVNVELRHRKFLSINPFSCANSSKVRVSSTHPSDMQLLSQIFTCSSSIRVLGISDTYIGPNGEAHFANLCRRHFTP